MIQNLDSTKPGAGQSLHETQRGSGRMRFEEQGKTVHAASIVELRDGKIAKRTD